MNQRKQPQALPLCTASQRRYRALFGSLIGPVAASIALLSIPATGYAKSEDHSKKKDHGPTKEKVPWYSKKLQIPKTGDTQLSVRLASFYQYFHENYDANVGNDQYSAFVNRLTFKSTTRLKKSRNLAVTARIDTQNMWEHDLKNRPGHLCAADANGKNVTADSVRTCNFGNDFRLERLSLDYTSRRIALTLGDFNVNLARGMGLSIRRLDQIGVDAAIKGVKFRYKHRRVDVKVLGGFANRQNSDFAVRRRVRDPGYLAHYCGNKGWNKADRYGNSLWSICSDLIVGGRVDVKKLPGRTKLGLHHASIFFGGYGQDAPSDGEKATGKQIHLTGMDVTPGRISKVWDTYLGGAVALASHPGASDPGLQKYNGIAVYNSNNLSFGQWNALIEAKYYDQYLVAYDLNPTRLQYAELATLERFDQWLPGAASTAGGRVRLDYFLPEKGWDFYLNGMAYAFDTVPFKDQYGTFSKDGGALAVHTFGGFEYHKHGSPLTLNVALGYRSETKNKRDEETGKRLNKRTLPHFDLFAKFPLGTTGNLKHTLSITNNTWYETKGYGDNELKFWRGTLIAEYTMAPIMTISLMGGFTTENTSAPNTLVLDRSRVCTEKAAKSKGECKPQLYPGIAARFNFLGRSYFQFFAGKRLGGLVCVNGSCRTLPDFVGGEAQLVLSF